MVSVRRVVPVLLIAAAIPVFAAKTPKSSSHPPRQLHRVGDHWTPYNPPDPATYPAGAKTYAIKQGDTLWGLAQQFFKNAYLWPQLWESNTWITDAHWIYPGDVLLLEGEAAAAATSSESGSAESGSQILGSAPPSGVNASLTPATGLSAGATSIAPGTNPVISATPVPLGSENEVYCFGYIGDPDEPMPNRIASYEDVEMRFEPGALRQDLGGSITDLVYIDGGTSTGIMPGETYLIVEPGVMVHHPRTKDLLGRHYDFRGQVKILCADEKSARGIITQSCFDIRIGSRLKPLPQIPIPLARIPAIPGFCDPQSGKPNGFIVSAQGGWGQALGTGLLVEIDLGKDDQLQPGDFLTVWRDSMQPGQPRRVLGEMGVLTTESHTSTGIIVGMRYAMEIGDHVERQ